MGAHSQGMSSGTPSLPDIGPHPTTHGREGLSRSHRLDAHVVIINRPGVAGAVLQTPPSLINQLIK